MTSQSHFKRWYAIYIYTMLSAALLIWILFWVISDDNKAPVNTVTPVVGELKAFTQVITLPNGKPITCVFYGADLSCDWVGFQSE